MAPSFRDNEIADIFNSRRGTDAGKYRPASAGSLMQSDFPYWSVFAFLRYEPIGKVFVDTEKQKIIISGEQVEVKAVPGFSVTAEGIYQGGKEKNATHFVCGFLYVDCILVVGKMRNIVVRGIDIATGKFFEHCFPRAELLGYQDSVTHDLMNAGLAINLQHSKEVRRYLAAYPVTDIVLGYTSTGWAATDDERKMFVLPQGTVKPTV